MAESADIALIGLEDMGQNIILNMNDHGFTVCAYNRTTDKVDAFLANEAKGTKIIGARSVEEMIKSLKKPRRVMLLLEDDEPVDDFIDLLLPHLERGDIVIDGGDSEYEDTNHRVKDLSAKGILFVGSGVSDGEEGARYGPSLMPGGNPEAWPHIKDIFQSIAAKVGNEPCCDWVGEDGSGHFVKMVHSGIEYGDVQLICEAYRFMEEGLKLDNDQMSQVRDISFDATCSVKFEEFLKNYPAQDASNAFDGDVKEFLGHIHKALYASKIITYAHGFMLLNAAAAADAHNWKLNYGGIAHMWRGGIFPHAFLGNIKEAFDKNPELNNLLLDPFFKNAISECQTSWRKVVCKAFELGIPIPCFSSALIFYDSFSLNHPPENKFYSPAHTYELYDDIRVRKFIQTNWTRWRKCSTTYQV